MLSIVSYAKSLDVTFVFITRAIADMNEKIAKVSTV